MFFRGDIINSLLKEKKLFVLDMDGTLYLGDEIFKDTHRFLAKLKETGKDFIFLSNNSSKSLEDYYKKLIKLNLPHHDGVITTSGEVMIEFLNENHKGKKVFLCGTESLKQSFEKNGITLAKYDADIAVMAFNPDITYSEIKTLCDLVRSGIPYFCTHPDSNCPDKTGLLPDCGAFIELVRTSAGRYPDKIVGKPSIETINHIIRLKNAHRSEMVIVGDRVDTDIKMGFDNEITTVLMLTGATSKQDLQASLIKPTLISENLAELIELL